MKVEQKQNKSVLNDVGGKLSVLIEFSTPNSCIKYHKNIVRCCVFMTVYDHLIRIMVIFITYIILCFTCLHIGNPLNYSSGLYLQLFYI